MNRRDGSDSSDDDGFQKHSIFFGVSVETAAPMTPKLLNGSAAAASTTSVLGMDGGEESEGNREASEGNPLADSAPEVVSDANYLSPPSLGASMSVPPVASVLTTGRPPLSSTPAAVEGPPQALTLTRSKSEGDIVSRSSMIKASAVSELSRQNNPKARVKPREGGTQDTLTTDTVAKTNPLDSIALEVTQRPMSQHSSSSGEYSTSPANTNPHNHFHSRHLSCHHSNQLEVRIARSTAESNEPKAASAVDLRLKEFPKLPLGAEDVNDISLNFHTGRIGANSLSFPAAVPKNSTVVSTPSHHSHVRAEPKSKCGHPAVAAHHQHLTAHSPASSRPQSPRASPGRDSTPPQVVKELPHIGSSVRRFVPRDEDEQLETQHRRTTVSSALHAIPWLQRRVEPQAGYGSDQCGICASPKFWERLDWTFRATFLAVLPATILSLDPSTTTYFALPSMVASFAYWITAPTFGSGMRELAVVIKGSVLALILFLIVLTINPKSEGLFVALYFIQILFVAFVAESVKKTSAWCISIFMLQLYSDPVETNYLFVWNFFLAVLIGCAFGLVAFILPRINWSLDLAKSCCSTYGSSLSIAIQGVVHSFWTKSELEREMCLIRIKQLLATTGSCQTTLSSRLGECDYEPHTGLAVAAVQARSEFLDSVTRIVFNMLQVVENVDDDPDVANTPLCSAFGVRVADSLTILASAMDSIVLKICDFQHPITASDLEAFRSIREEFQSKVSDIRQEIILSNDKYRTDESDIFLGFFLFCVDELAETIGQFQEPLDAPNRLLVWIRTPWEDLRGLAETIQFFFATVSEGELTRRAKEAIKLALSMTIPLLLQVFLLPPEDATPVAGPSIIAWVYQKTGAESFHYASNRVLGTVVGSLTALIAVQLADGALWILYLSLAVLSLVGNFVQTSQTYTQAGNAMVFSIISIISQYKDRTAALSRIQQNVFAILIYFVIAYGLWPVRAVERIQLELDSALRAYREGMYKLLRGIDTPQDEALIVAEAQAHLKECRSRVAKQAGLVPAAIKEPTLIGAPFPEQPWLRLIRSQKVLSTLGLMMSHAFEIFSSSEAEHHGDHSVHWVVLRKLSPHARQCAELIFECCDLYLLSLSHAEMVPMNHLVRLRLALVQVYRDIVDTYANTLILRLSGPAEGEEICVTTGRQGARGPCCQKKVREEVSDASVLSPTGSRAALGMRRQESEEDTELLSVTKYSPQHAAATRRTAIRPAALRPDALADEDLSLSLSPAMVASPPRHDVSTLNLLPSSVKATFDDGIGNATFDSNNIGEGERFVLQNRDIHSLEAFLFGIRAAVTEVGEFQKALLELQHVSEMNSKL